MSEKRFEVVLNEFDEVEYVIDKKMMEDRDFAEFMDFVEILAKENEQLKSYIDTIFEGNSHICKRLDVEDVQFYCQRNRDYCFPTCTYAKCFDENNLIGLKDEIRRCNE